MLKFKQFTITEEDSDSHIRTRAAQAHEKAVHRKWVEHGLVQGEAARASAGTSTVGPDILSTHPKTGAVVHVEVKHKISDAKLASVQISKHPKTGKWDFSSATKRAKPRTIAHIKKHVKVNGVPLLQHLNSGSYDERGFTTDPVNDGIAHAHAKDKGVHILHIGDRGSYRAGESETSDEHNTKLPVFRARNIRGRSSEVVGRFGRERKGGRFQLDFKVRGARDIKSSPIHAGTDEGIQKLKANMTGED